MKTIQTKNYIAAVVYLITISGLLIFGVLPYINKLSANQSEYNQTRDELDLTLKKYTQLVALSKNEQEILAVKEDVFELIPETENTADFVVKLEALAKDLSIPNYISTISTSQTTAASTKTTKKKKDTKKEIEYSIGFTSNYTTVESFLDRLFDFPRYTTIRNINISGYNAEIDTLNFKVNGVIYYGK